MKYFSRQSLGLVGTLFVSACCLGAAPIIAATAAIVGLGAIRHVFNIYALAPLMTLSVAWIAWNRAVQGRALTGAARRYAVFWVGLSGGVLAWVGVILPHVVHATRHTGTALIIVGMVVLIGASIKGLLDQRQRKIVPANERVGAGWKA